MENRRMTKKEGKKKEKEERRIGRRKEGVIIGIREWIIGRGAERRVRRR